MADGQVIFEIKGDNKPIKESLNETTSAIKTAGQEWDKAAGESGGSISSALTGAFETVVKSAAFYKIGKMLVDLGVESINLASDLQEVQNVVDVTFGPEGSKKIEQWAATAAKNYGITELQAKQYTSTIGAMMKSSGLAGDEIVDMSIAMAGLAADMASFYNLPFEEAFQKIAAGIAGETEPLRRLGINMSVANLEAYNLAHGIETAWEDMSAGDQIIQRQKYLLDATADAQGDFLRTNDSFANTLKRIETSLTTLKSNLGEELMKLANPLTQFMADFLEMITIPSGDNVLDDTAKSIADAEGQATQAQGILAYMDELQKKYGDAAEKTGEWAAAMGQLKSVFPEINQFIDEQTGKLTVSNEELGKYIENTKQAAEAEARRKAISDVAEMKVATAQEYYTTEVNRDIAQSKADEAWNSIVSFIKKYEKNFTGQGLDLKQLMAVARNYNMSENGGPGNQAYNDAEAMLSQLESIYQEETQKVGELNTQLGVLSEKMASAAAQYDIAVAALARMEAAAAAAASALDSVASSGGGVGAGGSFNMVIGGGKGNPNVTLTPFAVGLDSVPFDGFLASLHEGESILTAEEARVWRNMKYGPSLAGNQFDYGAMGSAIGANMPNFNGMQVVWNGQVLGRVIAQQQANSLRTMERSGWRG